MRVAIAIAVAFCASCSVQSPWVVPDTPQGQQCSKICSDARIACLEAEHIGNNLRGPAVADTADTLHGMSGPNTGPVAGTGALECRYQLDKCLTRCPGARRRK